MREGYRETSLGVIPEYWSIHTLGDIGEFKNGINKGKEDFGHGYPMVNLNDVFGLLTVNTDDLGLVNSTKNERKEYKLKRGDVLFIRSSVKPSGVGLTAVVPKDLDETVFSGFIIRFRDNDILDFEYKKHCFHGANFRKRLLAKSTISANTNINQNSLSSLQLVVPPLPEQRKIAEILSTVDDKIDVIDQQISETQELKKGLMQRLLTKGIGHTKFKDSPLGEIPVSWEVGTFNQIATNNSTKFQKQEGKCIELEHIDQRTGRLLGYDNVSNKSSIKNHFLIGDVLFCKLRPYLRKYWYCEFEGGCTSELLVLRSKKTGDSRFIYYVVQQDSFIVHTVSSSYGTKMPRTSWKIISEYRLPIPPISEQHKIAEVLSTVDEKLEILQDKKQECQELKKGLMQQLLTGKIRVQTN